MVPGVIAGLIIGRFACIVNGDTVGDVTSLPWAFIYTNPGAMIKPELFGLPVHPYALYEMMWNGLGLVSILWLRKRSLGDGSLILVFIAVYAAGRFLLTFVRVENQFFLGLQQAQLIAVAMLAAAATMALFLRVQGRQLKNAIKGSKLGESP